MAKKENIIQKQHKILTKNKEKIKKITSIEINPSVITLNNKKSELIIFENYDLYVETDDTDIIFYTDFDNINEYILMNMHPYVVLSKEDGMSIDNSAISLNYYWRKIDSIYRLYTRIDAYVTQNYYLTNAYITYKIAVRNKNVWSKLEKILS